MDMSEYIRKFRSKEGIKKIFAEEEKEKEEILNILSTLLALEEEEEEEEDDLSKETEAMDDILFDVYLKGFKKGIQTSQKSLDYEDDSEDEGSARWRVLRNGVALPILFKNKELAKDFIYKLIERQQSFNYYELALMDSLFFKH
jgi:hypothetical protein